MVSQTLEDKLEQFLNEAGNFQKASQKISQLEESLEKIKENHLAHIESDIKSLKEDVSEIKRILKNQSK